MTACQCAPFYFSVVNLLPKLALGKLEAKPGAGCVQLIAPDGCVKLLPCGNQAAYWAALLEALTDEKTVSLVPAWAADNLGKHYKVEKCSSEYVMSTEDVIAQPGGHNRQVRGNVNKARKLCTWEHLHADTLQEFLDLNRVWYRQNADRKFRTYDKTSIDWVLSNWSVILQADPLASCVGVRHEGKLISLNIGGTLTQDTWTAYTQRYDREAPVKAANSYGYTLLGEVYSDLPWENDGTADSTAIRAWKERLKSCVRPFYKVSHGR